MGRLKQRFGLAVFYYSTNGGNWENDENWLSGEEECIWNGIVCSTESNDVTSILLSKFFPHCTDSYFSNHSRR